MSLVPFPGISAHPTHHCVTGSLQRAYEFHGHPISEEMLLGLGEGIGFVYWHMKGAPPMFGGRANVGRPGEEGMERAAGRRTGVQVEIQHTASERKAEDALITLLEAGQPAVLQVDMGFLPYFDFPEEFHFGGHVIAVVGYDKASRVALVADRDLAFHEVELGQLAKARGSKFKPFPPQNGWYTFDFAGRREPRAPEAWEAILAVARRMLNPPIANLGTRGIVKAAEAVRAWPRAMSEGEIRGACFNAFIFIDATGGTGGGIFRYMYARFLLELAQMARDRQLPEIADQLHEVGDRWQTVALAFKAASEAPDPRALLADVVAPLPDIARREELIWRSLEQLASEKN